MKTADDPRHLKRVKLFKKLFVIGFKKGGKISPEIKAIAEKLPQIDKIIADRAPDWPVDKLNKVDLAILRLAIFELELDKKNPSKVVIDEAVELAKAFGTESTHKFINGVLGSVIKDE